MEGTSPSTAGRMFNFASLCFPAGAGFGRTLAGALSNRRFLEVEHFALRLELTLYVNSKACDPGHDILNNLLGDVARR